MVVIRQYRRGVRLFIVGVLLLPILPVASQPQISVRGDCNVTVVTTGSGSATVQLPGHICQAGDDPQKSLRVMYYWLDPASASFLVSSRMEESLRPILGETPIVIPTPVLVEAKDLIAKFGSKLDSQSTLLGDYTEIAIRPYDKRTAETKINSTRSLINLARGINIYDGFSPVGMPEIAGFQEFIKHAGFPNNYSVFYCPPSDRSSWSPENAIPSMVMWRFADPQDLTNYSSNLNSLRLWASAQRHPLAPNTDYMRIKPKAVAAMLHIARQRWPKDFLTIFGQINECGGSLDFTLYPREFFLQIAVLENISTRSFVPVSGIKVLQASGPVLRTADEDKNWSERTLAFPPSALRPGEKIVVPIRIDFRRHRQELESIANRFDPALNRAMEAFFRAQSSIRVWGEEGSRQAVWKPASVFPSPRTPRIETAYTYGPRLSLVSAISENAEIPLRPFDPSRIFMVANFETGSCPFLYTRHEGEPDLLKVGRVLKSASSPYNPGVYEASFDGSLREIVIQEEELETTYLSKVSLVGRDIHGVVLDHVSVSDVSLGIGGALTLRPARTEHVASYELRIEGYYVPIGSALLEAASRDRMAP